MSFAINPKIPREFTPPITFLRGEYALHKYKVPYFSTVLPMEFVANRFSLIDEIPNSERIEWTLEELFQRDIAWDRIDEGLEKYLLNESTQQFFNSLTVALLPKKGHGLADAYDMGSESIPPMEGQLETSLQIGGIQIQPFAGSQGQAGQLRWDPKETSVIAVDGQHRLAAIKSVAKKLPPEKLEITSVPVIFLLPHEKVGFSRPSQMNESVFSSLRRIFIDLNVNARPVSRARNILLNDTDISSVCTRSLVGTKLSNTEEADRIPLGLVDWVSEKNKFESGQFLSTILVLEEIVKYTIDLKNLRNPEDEYDKDIEKWFESNLSPSPEQLDAYMNQARRCFNQEVPLTFLPDQIVEIGELFQKRWRPWLYRLFTELSPYKDLVSFSKEKDLIKPEMVNLYVEEFVNQGERAERRSQEIIDAIKQQDKDWNRKTNFDEPLAHIDEAIKDENWFFKVVFQKALFHSFLSLARQRGSLGISGGKFSDEMSQFADLWVSSINRLVEKGLDVQESKVPGLTEPFWVGIGLNSERKIEYTNVGGNRIEAWLNAWVIMSYIHSVEGAIPTESALLASDNQVHNMLENTLFKNKKVESGLTKVVKAKFDNLTQDEEVEKTAESRHKRYMVLRKLISTDN
jgi:DGQHR domain-containing protein